jgi:lipoyl synthase
LDYNASTMTQTPHHRLPDWLRVKTGKRHLTQATRELVHDFGLHTVCEGAHCPNIGECYSRKVATFMILGDTCTRNCGFCAVNSGDPAAVDPGEPERVAQASASLGLKYVVITSVTRDDLPDGGAGQFARTIAAVHEAIPGASVEVLTPDFGGDAAALETVLAAVPEVFNHNAETVRRLQTTVRPQANYDLSLGVLREARAIAPGIPTKSGIMVGLGETEAEVQETLADLRAAGCEIVTIGQYLRPSRRHLPVAEYVPPEQFAAYERHGYALGFRHVASGPFVRSSYQAERSAGLLHETTQ